MSLNAALILSRICVPLMVTQSAIGLFVPGTYAKDGAWGRAVWLGNDVVNLVVFAPLLAFATVLAKRGPDKGRIFWLGMQALVTYNYIYYPLAVAYDRFFLLYLAILGVSLYSFVFGMTRMDLSAYGRHLPGKRGRVAAACLMLAFALVLSLLWIGLSVHYLLTGELKLAVTPMVSTFDLLLIVTPVVLSAIWLLKGQARGYALLTMMALVSGLYCFVLMAYTPFALRAGLPDAWTMLPLWILLCALCLPAAVILLRSPQRS